MLIVALGFPLAIQLQRRATAEIQTNALVTAEAIAAAITAENLERERDLVEIAVDEAQAYGARVIVLDADGILLADSEGTERVGELYAEPTRPEIVSALRGVPTSEIRASEDLGTDIVATAVPVFDEDGRVIGAVRITEDVQDVTDNVRRTTLGLVAIGAAGLAAGLLLAFGLAASLSRPLTKLADAARRLGSGDLSARAENVGGANEIEELGRSFDEMADRLERTVRAQREFVANASHQLRTPLTGMKLRLETAIADADDTVVRKQLEAADREVDRLAEIVDRLLETSKQIEEGAVSNVEVRDAVSRAITRWEARARQLGSTLLASGDGGVARAEPSDVDQVLDNLIDNALSYAGGQIDLVVGRADGSVTVSVRDRGPGIAPEDVGKVTERFYRGAGAPAGGSGLGLAIARELTERWGGSMSVSSTPGEGTTVEVRLPATGG